MKKSTNVVRILCVGLFLGALAMPTFSATNESAKNLSVKNVGFIDMTSIVENSTQTKALKAKEMALAIELQKFSIDAKEEMINDKTKMSKDDLEKQLIDKISQKKVSLENQYKEDLINVQQKVKTAIGTVEQQKQVDLIFTKSSIVSGGINLTDDVIKELNLLK